MAVFKLLTLAASTLVLARGEQPGSSTAPRAAEANCLDQFNAARDKVGLEACTAPTTKQLLEFATGSKRTEDKNSFLEAVCNGGLTEKTTNAETHKLTGTFAYFVQSGEKENCDAAVESHKEGFEALGSSLPPAFHKDTTPYNNHKAVSFVSIYNPKPKATLECIYVTCPATVTTTTTVSPTKEPSSSSTSTTTQSASTAASTEGSSTAEGEEKEEESSDEGSETRREAPAGSRNALVCISSPPALVENEPPYSEEQYNKIRDAFANSADTALPALLAFAAGAFGIAFA